jgi:hypothetical protein
VCDKIKAILNAPTGYEGSRFGDELGWGEQKVEGAVSVWDVQAPVPEIAPMRRIVQEEAFVYLVG